jgi:signal transduction histidine kinase/CheY-like chemotaxis protein
MSAGAVNGVAAASATNYDTTIEKVYGLIASKPFNYDPSEVDTFGADALKLNGEARIYGLWRVLYAYKNSGNTQKLNDWRQRISNVARQQNDSKLDLLARFMGQVYENEGAGFASMTEKDWALYSSVSDEAFHNIVLIERERQLQAHGDWADAIDVGEKLVIRLRDDGTNARSALNVAHQTLAFGLLKVGDTNGYADNMLASASLMQDNAFFLQKMDFLYDLAFFSAQKYNINSAEKLQKFYDLNVSRYNVADMKALNESLCAFVADKADKPQDVIACLEKSDVMAGKVKDSYDAKNMYLLTRAFARRHEVEKAAHYLNILKTVPPSITPRDVLLESYIEAQMLAGQGRNAEAVIALDRWAQDSKKAADERRIAGIQDMYKALRKELDSKTAEARLLNQQVHLRNWLLATAGAVVLLLIAIGVGAALWVVRMRRMQWRLKEASDHAEAANAAKSRFLAVMSHELRTPLNGVLGMAQALKRENLSESQRAKVDTLAESGETLLMLLNDVLDLSRIEAGKVELSPTPASMKDMIERVFNTFTPTIGEKPVALKYDLDPTAAGLMSFDVLRVYQCLSNLVSNAVKFTNEGVIRVVASAEKHLDRPGYTVRVEVRDTGIGISKAALSKLFEAYSQADASTARKYGGSGLGLSITQRLIELMGGSVSVTSEEGAGSVFVMTFEAGEVETPAEDASEIAPEDVLPHGVRILLVDDHPVNRKVARLFLEPFGFDITEAVDGQEALDAGMEDYDLILMDVNMPRLGGIDATRQFRASEAAGKHVPIIALTADALPEQIEACLAAGMDAHVSKPIVMDKLIDTVVSLLGEDVLQAAQSA